jgi:hypothetical protein
MSGSIFDKIRNKKPSPIQDSVRNTLDEPTKYRDVLAPKREDRPSSPEPLNPFLTSLAGGLLDSASTYNFLKRGTKTEGNALVSGLSKKSPEALTAMGIAANVAIPYALKKLGKKYPKLARIMAGGQGALQFGYGSANLGTDKRSSANQYDEGNMANVDKGVLSSQGRLKR